MALLQPTPRRGNVRSAGELRKITGKGPLYDWMVLDSQGVSHFFDDFLGDAINLDMYALANSGGAAAADFATNVQKGGAIRGTTGTTDNGSVSLIMPINWYGDQNCAVEFRVKCDVVL